MGAPATRVANRLPCSFAAIDQTLWLVPPGILPAQFIAGAESSEIQRHQSPIRGAIWFDNTFQGDWLSDVNHRTFSRKGDMVRSPAKTAANRAKATALGNAVHPGKKSPPRGSCMPPAPEAIARLLADYCRQTGITRLEVFGSTARGEARRDSDVDLLATFADNPGLGFFTMEEDMEAILGVPVHLLTRDSVEQMSNPYRRNSILGDAKVIYG